MHSLTCHKSYEIFLERSWYWTGLKNNISTLKFWRSNSFKHSFKIFSISFKLNNTKIKQKNYLLFELNKAEQISSITFQLWFKKIKLWNSHDFGRFCTGPLKFRDEVGGGSYFEAVTAIKVEKCNKYFDSQVREKANKFHNICLYI